jgi:hypothetical protein
MVKTTALLVPLALLGLSGVAHATESRIQVGFGLNSKEIDGRTNTLVAPRLDADISVSDHFGIAATLPLTSLSRSGGGEGTFRFGNPYVGGFWETDIEVLTLKVGAGVALPVAGQDASGSAATAYGTAQALAGLGDFWLYQPGTATLAIPVEAKLDLALIEVRAEATWALLIATKDYAETDTTLQLAGEALFNFPFIGVGARIQSVWVPTASGDKRQVSVAPVVEAEVGPVFARTLFLINLDRPSGFSFDSGTDKYWGWHLGAGVHF